MTTQSISTFSIPSTLAPTAPALVMLPAASSRVRELQGARREVRGVSRIYGARATVLTDAAATPEVFLDSAPQYDLLHLVSHGSSSDLPYQNAMEFGSRRLRAYDVYRLQLRRAPLVMLAACRTANSGGGPLNLSLAEAFLQAGASAVVGSLWDVDDTDTAELSVAFHRQLARGIAPQDALRNVQLRWLRAGRPIRTWAAFQIAS